MDSDFGTGGAILATSLDKLRRYLVPCEPAPSTSPNPPHINLASALIDSGSWPVRHQGHRNTCSAFCAVTLAELTAFHEKGQLPVTDYSEEFLYAMIDEVDYCDVVAGVTEREIALFDETGARFLAQANKALTVGALVDETDMPYDTDDTADPAAVATPSKNLVEQAKTTGLANMVNLISPKKDGELTIGPKRQWVASKDDSPEVLELVPIFIELLQNKRPIAAGFPLLVGSDHDIWFGSRAFETGHVFYPTLENKDDMEIEGGHSVCIVGYDTRGFDEGDGVFIFRNSFGQDFGWLNDDGPAPLRPPAKGYGTIAFRDVEWFCLEFMYRALAEQSANPVV